MISCINFRYFTAPASKFPKPACEIFYIKYVRYAVFLAVYIININSPNVFAARENARFFINFAAGFYVFVAEICG